MTELQQLASDPLLFFEQLRISSAHGDAMFGDVMADFQRERFEQLAPALLAVRAGETPPIGKFFWDATKGASKDSDLACAVLYLLAFAPRPLTIQVGAADKDQADELKKAAVDILRLNSWLAELVEAKGFSLRNRMTESTCEIIAADVAGSHGARPDVLILNELSHIQKKEFAENLLDNATKVPRGLVCIATNAGWESTWQHEWRERARQSDRWSFHQYAQPAPWLSADDIDEAKLRNPANRQARLFHGKWLAENEGDFLSAEVIARAVTLDGPTPEAERGWIHALGCDLGVTHDASAIVVVARHVGWLEERERRQIRTSTTAALVDCGIVEPNEETESIWHEGTGRLRVCAVRRWKAEQGQRVSIAGVERAIERMHARYNLCEAAIDPWQAELLVERLDAKGIPTRRVPFTSASLQDMAVGLLEAFTENQIALFDDEHLLADLKRLRVVDRAAGIRTIAPRDKSGHGDVATSLSLALLAVRSHSHTPNRISRELVCYP